MDDEIELVSDGEGIALLGDAGAIERFLASEGLPSQDLARVVSGVEEGVSAGGEARS